jgi:uncharacterized protein HemY
VGKYYNVLSGSEKISNRGLLKDKEFRAFDNKAQSNVFRNIPLLSFKIQISTYI